MSFYLDIDDESAPALLETEQTGIPRVIEHAADYLSNAVAVWRMIDPAKADRLERFVGEELQYPPGQASLRLSREQVERIVGLLEGIETAAVGNIMDEDYHVPPDKVGYVNEHAPGLAVLTTDGEGRPLYVLDRITEVEWLRAFLETALRLGLDVIRA
ncbi:MAG: hypothetical protein QOH49_94 [Acidobacteriota bacterium]|jgi:hypothetical protein|nr:hypothetical protein [Acidobacteriota bacterium]